MNEKEYRLILSDGSEICGLRLNGNNFISDAKITEAAFDGKLSPVTICSGQARIVHEHMALVQIAQVGEQWWFVLRDIPQSELEAIQIRADIDFLAMMTDVQL